MNIEKTNVRAFAAIKLQKNDKMPERRKTMNAIDLVCWDKKHSGVRVCRFIAVEPKGHVLCHGRLKWGRGRDKTQQTDEKNIGL